jgi:hypothetical protein
MVPLPVAHPVVCVGSLEETTCPLWSIRAQNTMLPAMDRLDSLLAVTAPLRKARVPMLPAGMLIA